MSTEDNKANMDPACEEAGTAQVKKLLNVLLDISGILLGIFLVGVGTWVLLRGCAPPIIWWFVIISGISAFLIHLFRYLGWNVRRFFGLRGPTKLE